MTGDRISANNETMAALIRPYNLGSAKRMSVSPSSALSTERLWETPPGDAQPRAPRRPDDIVSSVPWWRPLAGLVRVPRHRLYKAMNLLWGLAVGVIVVLVTIGIGAAMVGSRAFNGIEPERYDLGAYIDLRVTAPTVPYLRHGWGERDEDGTWTEGAVAELEVPLQTDTPPAAFLEIDYLPHIDDGQSQLNFQVLVNGTTVGHWQFSSDNASNDHSRATIPIEALGQRQPVLITLLFDSPMARDVPSFRGIRVWRLRLVAES